MLLPFLRLGFVQHAQNARQILWGNGFVLLQSERGLSLFWMIPFHSHACGQIDLKILGSDFMVQSQFFNAHVQNRHDAAILLGESKADNVFREPSMFIKGLGSKNSGNMAQRIFSILAPITFLTFKWQKAHMWIKIKIPIAVVST